MSESAALSGREQSLVDRGYEESMVRRLSHFSEEVLQASVQRVFREITASAERTEHPYCIYIGGQPGCGKSTMLRSLKKTAEGKDAVMIVMDDYRSYHPHYAEMEEEIRRRWADRQETEWDSPGNDIADFTQRFAGNVIDEIIEMVSSPVSECGKEIAYPILFEWAMRESTAPIEVMRLLKSRGYTNHVRFIAVKEMVSRKACALRAEIMNSRGRVFRRIPTDFHDRNITELPMSCRRIYEQGVLQEPLIEDFRLVSRDHDILWSSGDAEELQAYYEAILRGTAQPPECEDCQINEPAYAEDAFLQESVGLGHKVWTFNEKCGII